MDAWKNARAIKTLQEEVKELKTNIVRIMNILTSTAPKNANNYNDGYIEKVQKKIKTSVKKAVVKPVRQKA